MLEQPFASVLYEPAWSGMMEDLRLDCDWDFKSEPLNKLRVLLPQMNAKKISFVGRQRYMWKHWGCSVSARRWLLCRQCTWLKCIVYETTGLWKTSDGLPEILHICIKIWDWSSGWIWMQSGFRTVSLLMNNVNKYRRMQRQVES